MSTSLPKHPFLKSAAFAALGLIAVGQAQAADKFKVTSVDCEWFWQWKHTPVIHYDIVEERRADYNVNPDADYFRQAALRTVEHCDRTSSKPQQPLGPPRRIRGVFFRSNDGRFEVLYDLDASGFDPLAGIRNDIADRYAADQRMAEQHQRQLDEIGNREARAKQVKDAEAKAVQDRVAAENAREKLFFDRRDLQVSRLGTEATAANFTFVDDVRTNPFHFRKLGLAVVRTQFNRMLNDRLALFGNDLAPVLVHIEDVDRFTRSGETVMLAFKVIERGEVERSYGSLPEILLSALKAEPIFGVYVGAYTCPGNDCTHVFDAPPPT